MPRRKPVLGRVVRAPTDTLDLFPTPEGVEAVQFTTDEFTSLCPVTGQPDFGAVTIRYHPAASCIESKSLKLYLWTFRARGTFCEGAAAEIAAKVYEAARPHGVAVLVRQRVRGGIETQAIARFPLKPKTP